MQDRIPSKPRITLHRHVKYALVNAKLPTDSLQIYHNIPTHQRRGRGEYWLSGNDVANLQERIKNSEEEAELLHAKSRNWRSLNANGSRELYASTMNVVDRTERKTRDSTGLFKALEERVNLYSSPVQCTQQILDGATASSSVPR